MATTFAAGDRVRLVSILATATHFADECGGDIETSLGYYGETIDGLALGDETVISSIDRVTDDGEQLVFLVDPTTGLEGGLVIHTDDLARVI